MEKTKKCLMTQYPFARGRAFVCKNIGDYIQSVASKQYIDHLDGYIEQEEANFYCPKDGIKARLIMNGWFQWRAENWPPSDYIIPLLISMHISPLKKDLLLTPKGIEFLKKNGPVGCRDHYTENLLKKMGIPAYFSGCVTLTLGKKYFTPLDKRNGVYFVDPYFSVPEIKSGGGEKKYYTNLQLKPLSFLYFTVLLLTSLQKCILHFSKDILPKDFWIDLHGKIERNIKLPCFIKHIQDFSLKSYCSMHITLLIGWMLI